MKLLQPEELEEYLKNLRVRRSIKTIQNHHTYLPDYERFYESGAKVLVKNMKRYHKKHRGFSDIAQHFTTFPDGTIYTGRSMNKNPAGIKGANSGSICMEHVGNFDAGNDKMTTEQKSTIILLNGLLCKKFALPVNTKTIIYHHWYDRDTGKRTNGKGYTKTCPGTTFFGGNKVADCKANLIPMVKIIT